MAQIEDVVTSATRSEWKEALITAGLLLAVLIAAFFPILFHGRLLLPTDLIDSMTLPFSKQYGPPHASNPYVVDGLLQFYPYKLMLRDAWLHGQFAFWNPYNLCGFPQYAETMATNFDVLNTILLLAPMPMAFHLYVISPLFIAGLGLYLFLRTYNVRPWIGRIFATGYMLCGLFITHLLPHFIPGSFCWMPFILLATKMLFESYSFRWLVLGAFFLALGFCGGNIQTSAFLIFTLGIFCLLAEPDQRSITRRSQYLIAIVGIALLLSAIMWLPTLEYFYQAKVYGEIRSSSLNRGYTLIERLLTIPLLFTFFLPQSAGPANGLNLYNALGLYTIDFNASIGYFPLLIGAWSCIHYWKDRRIRPFAVLVLLGFVLPIATPLYHLLYHRFFILSIFGLCCAGGMGLELALRNSDPSLKALFARSSKIFMLVFALIILIAIVITLQYSTFYIKALNLLSPKLSHSSFSEGNPSWISDRIAATLNNYGLTSVNLLLPLLTIAAGYLLLRHRKKKEENTLIALWIITAIQVAWFAYSWLPHVDPNRYPLFPSMKLTNDLAGDARTFIDRRVDPHDEYIFIDNENVAYGISQLSGFESLLPRSVYLTVPQLFDNGVQLSKYLGSNNVKYVVSNRSVTYADSGLQIVDSSSVALFQNQAVQPRARLNFHAMRVGDSDAIRILMHGQIDGNTVLLSVTDAAPLLNTIDSSASVTIEKQSNNEVLLSYSSKVPCYLVLSDTYYPGWTAYIDSTETPIYRANYAMRAVLVPRGKHTVEMRFNPILFRLGAWISVLTFCICAIASTVIRHNHQI